MQYRYFLVVLVGVMLAGGGYVLANGYLRYTDTEVGFENEDLIDTTLETNASSDLAENVAMHLPAIAEPRANGRVQWSAYWREMTPEEELVYREEKREGTPRVGLQAGHWQLDDVPEELEGLRASSGAQGAGYSEQETVLEIARKTKALLEAEGILVDLLPATIPVDYYADAFVSIHADGSTSASVSGFKVAAPRRDFSGRAHVLIDSLYEEYAAATGLRSDPNITRRMSGYYAFNWRRYDHALHPRTPAAIIETGFMTSATDRAVIVNQPELAAKGIARGILSFLNVSF